MTKKRQNVKYVEYLTRNGNMRCTKTMRKRQARNGQESKTSNGNEYSLSGHARKRMAQRNLSPSDVEFAISYGQHFHRTGALFLFLGHRDFPSDGLRRFSRLEGTLILMDPKTRDVITVYRNRKGPRDIKRKVRYSLRKSSWRADS